MLQQYIHTLTSRLTTSPRSTSPTFSEQQCKVFYVPRESIRTVKECVKGSTVFPPCARGLNYLQMLEQRQHILLSYLDTLCVVPVRAFEPVTSCSADESLFT